MTRSCFDRHDCCLVIFLSLDFQPCPAESLSFSQPSPVPIALEVLVLESAAHKPAFAHGTNGGILLTL